LDEFWKVIFNLKGSTQSQSSRTDNFVRAFVVALEIENSIGSISRYDWLFHDEITNIRQDYSNQCKGRRRNHIEIITFIHQRLCPMEYNEKDVIWRHVKIAGQS
jgi:hypothetical protein